MVLATPRPLSTELVAPEPHYLRTVDGVAQAVGKIIEFLREVSRRFNSLTPRVETLESRILFTQTVAVVRKSIDYTMNAGDCIVIVDASVAPVTIGLPRAQTVAGRVFYIKKVDGSANNVVIAPYGSELLDDSLSLVTSTQYECFTVMSDGVAWWIV